MDKIYLLSNKGKELWNYQTFDDKDYMYSINSLEISLDSSSLVSTSREKVFLFNIGEKKEFDVNKYISGKEENPKEYESNQEIAEDTKENPNNETNGILDMILRLLGIKK